MHAHGAGRQDLLNTDSTGSTDSRTAPEICNHDPAVLAGNVLIKLLIR